MGQKIGKLSRRNRRIAKETYKYLKKKGECAYYEFVKEHRDFLKGVKNPSKNERKEGWTSSSQ